MSQVRFQKQPLLVTKSGSQGALNAIHAPEATTSARKHRPGLLFSGEHMYQGVL